MVMSGVKGFEGLQPKDLKVKQSSFYAQNDE